MMLYAIISQDKDDSLANRLLARPAHVQRLQALKDEGRLLLAGPHPAIVPLPSSPHCEPTTTTFVIFDYILYSSTSATARPSI